MRLNLLMISVLVIAVTSGYVTHPDKFAQYAAVAATYTMRVWQSLEANPVPVALALGTFLLTVLYHKAMGKSLRESVEVAATRVAVVAVPTREVAVEENPIVKRAQARATRTQLLTDQIGLQNRQRKLPEELLKAEKETCYTQQAVADAKQKLGEKHKAHNEATAKLKALRNEKAAGDEELAAIEAELKKLAPLV